MNKKPLVAVIPSYSKDRKVRLSHEYLEALLDCGAIPVTLPYTEDALRIRAYAEEFDGFLFSGGVDVDPVYYGEEKQFDSVEIDAERDRFELALLNALSQTEKPILGICRGIQLLNVAYGGSLVQHTDGHDRNEPNFVPTHRVRVENGTKLSAILGECGIAVNSFHHQAVKSLAPALRIAAFADDGTIEGLEAPDRPFLIGVQWHPELMYATAPHARALFRAFVEAARSPRVPSRLQHNS